MLYTWNLYNIVNELYLNLKKRRKCNYPFVCWAGALRDPWIVSASWSSRCGSAETNLTSMHENASSIPGLTYWAKDLVFPWAVVKVIDTAQILCGCGCGVGQ